MVAHPAAASTDTGTTGTEKEGKTRFFFCVNRHGLLKMQMMS